jgi:starch synthase (maltosyl-transferring)
MKIYNLFPRLAGPFQTGTAAPRAGRRDGLRLGVRQPDPAPGRSGSLYSIADYFEINKAFLKPRSRRPPRRRSGRWRAGRALGLRLMIDLVINHTAVDSPLVKEHPEWFVREGGGVASPFCVEADGNKVVWHDLAQLDHRSADAEGLLAYCVKIVEHLIGLGFTGFRCDAAYQIPTRFWQRLIERMRAPPGRPLRRRDPGLLPGADGADRRRRLRLHLQQRQVVGLREPLAAGAV